MSFLIAIMVLEGFVVGYVCSNFATMKRRAATEKRVMLAEHRVYCMELVLAHEANLDELNVRYGNPKGYRLPGNPSPLERWKKIEKESVLQ